MRIGNRQWIALASIASATAIAAGCSADDPGLDQYTGSTNTGGTTSGTTTSGTTTSGTTTGGTTTSGTTTSGTTTSGTTTGGTTTSGRKKPPKTKIKVRATRRHLKCRKASRSGRRKCRRARDAGERGRNEEGLPNIKVKGRRGKVNFDAEPNEPGTTFQCRVDGGAWKTCSSPHRTKRLKPGKHRFEVRAVSPEGEVDRSPARDRIVVRRTGKRK